VLGRGAVVGDQASIVRTVVGRDCVVGNGAQVSDSHIWEGKYDRGV
jgi:carbonic anhydrase/acetyltransferase-like protein (isoleucine patch superfamily)